MIGSWISGGVEWNIPHHHRASSTLNAGYEIVENPDGSKTIWIGETEQRQRLKWNIGLTIFPGKSYVEATFQMQNRTPLMQSFLYWANVSVHCNADYQVQFPPATAYGTTHSKTAYTDWPYAKTDEDGNPIDDSWWKSFPESNSTFAVNYSDDFLVGYDFGQDAGTAHWANHHVVPGKKFFLWGTESVWNDMLTEEDGAYLELMVGTFSDNQPDYSWLGPNEVRVTKQYWYPIKGIGGAKNVTLEAAVNLVRTSPASVTVGFNTTSRHDKARILVTAGDKTLYDSKVAIDPNTPFLKEFSVSENVADEDLLAAIYDEDGIELVSYSPAAPPEQTRPHPADRPKDPKDYDSVEELLLAAQRLEEFHNARLDPMPYYLEALERDPLNSRVNLNLGIYYARRAEWEKSISYLENAYMRLTGLHYMPDVATTGVIYHTNPKDGELMYYLGLVSLNLGRTEAAEAFFWKSTWYPGFQSASYIQLALIYNARGDAERALDAINRGLDLEASSTDARFIKARLLYTAGDTDGAAKLLEDNIAFDRLDFVSRIELARLNNDKAALADAIAHMGIPLQEVLEVCTFYGKVAAYDEAVELLEYVMNNCPKVASTPMQQNAVEPFTTSPLLNYYAGYYSHLAGNEQKALEYYRAAAGMSPDYCFPYRFEDILILNDAITLNPSDGKAHYYLGNLLYYLEQKDKGIEEWKLAAEIDSKYGMSLRNIGFAYNNYLNDEETAASYYNKAISVDSSDPKFFTELDQINEDLRVPSKERLDLLLKHKSTVLKSDDATSRLVLLYVDNGMYDEALDILETRHFRVWEGGQTVYTQFVDAHLLKGLGYYDSNRTEEALEHFLAAGTFPTNLETNELSNGPTVAKVAYYQGIAYLALGRDDEAKAAFTRCIDAAGVTSPWRPEGYVDEGMFYLALSQKQLGNDAEANTAIAKLRSYADEQLSPSVSAVDIYSKFGEDGSSNTITARAYFLKGLAEIADGNNSKADEYLTSALSLNPALVWAKYYQRNLK